jgi:hypothetical protein
LLPLRTTESWMHRADRQWQFVTQVSTERGRYGSSDQFFIEVLPLFQFRLFLLACFLPMFLLACHPLDWSLFLHLLENEPPLGWLAQRLRVLVTRVRFPLDADLSQRGFISEKKPLAGEIGVRGFSKLGVTFSS